jgi:choline dehydrogenase-like flavoprotein
LTSDAAITAQEAAATLWDVIVIGAGMGGSATAHALAARGLKVLVLEKGLGAVQDSLDIGKQAEDPAERERIGRWPHRLSGRVDGVDFDFFAPLGTGAGGSTVLYAAALDRFRPSDFAPRPHPAGGTLEWPVSFAAYQPFQRAEALLGVTGLADPLAPRQGFDGAGFDGPPPPPLGARDAWLFDRLSGAGLHPYRLHSGYRFVPGCGPCLGRACLRDCRRDAANSFLAPAMASGRVALCSRAAVLRINADARRVQSVTVQAEGMTFDLAADVFALAAGSYFSPVLLLKSQSEIWPQGLANHHDQVGRNLMFHTGRSLAIWTPRSLTNAGPAKSIVLRDFYDHPAGKFGEMQSTGAEARYGNILYALRLQLETSPLSNLPLMWHLLRIPAFLASRVLGRAAIFELIMEDLPYAGNRVRLAPGTPSGMRFDYVMPQELRDRYALYSAEVSRALKGLRHLFLTHKPGLNYGHPTGTCRIGRDPASSVAGPDGAVHGLANLFIADGSFMPSSGGTNPSLTIAAHGLRVGETIALAMGALAAGR